MQEGGGGRGVRLPLLLLRAGLRMLRGAARRWRGEEEPSRARCPPASSGPAPGAGGSEAGRGEGVAGEAPPDAHAARSCCQSGGEPRSTAAAGWVGRCRPGAGLRENCSCSRSPSSTQSYVIEVWMRKIVQAERGDCSSAAALPLRPGSPHAGPPPPRGAGLPRSRSPARPLRESRLQQPPRPPPRPLLQVLECPA